MKQYIAYTESRTKELWIPNPLVLHIRPYLKLKVFPIPGFELANYGFRTLSYPLGVIKCKNIAYTKVQNRKFWLRKTFVLPTKPG